MLDGLSFTITHIELIKIAVKKMLKVTLSNSEKILVAKTQQLKEVDKRIEELEESYFRKDIELSTYKRWFAKHKSEKTHILQEIRTADTKKRSKWDKLYKLLPSMTNIRAIYEKAKTLDQHRLIKAVFKQKFFSCFYRMYPFFNI